MRPGVYETGSYKILIVLDQFEEVADVPVPEILEDLRQAMIAVLANRFTNLHILLVYRTDAQARLGSWLQRVSSATRGLPAQYLLPLDEPGAVQALQAGFSHMRIGYEPSDLISKIIADIRAQGKGLYPPFIQMIGQTLAEAASESNSVITLELYSSLGGASRIVASYLIKRLEEFGSERPFAEQVLKGLVHSTGRRGEEHLEALQRATQLETMRLRPIIDGLVAKRMVRPLGEDKYEIIHDYFAQLIDSELVSSKERHTKQLKELLASKAAAYPVTKTPLSSNEMIQLYLIREQLLPHQSEETILLESCLGGLGPAWYWFPKNHTRKYVSLLENAVSHTNEEIRLNAFRFLVGLLGRDALPLARELLGDRDISIKYSAMMAIAQLGSRGDLSIMLEMLKNHTSLIRYNIVLTEAISQAVARLCSQEELPRLREMLKDKNRAIRGVAAGAIAHVNSTADLPKLWGMTRKHKYEIRRAAAQVIIRIAKRDDLPRLLEMLKDHDAGVREAVIKAIVRLATLDDLPKLQELVKDPYLLVREVAAQALAQAFASLANRDDLPTLRKLLRARDWTTREVAVKAIARLASRDDLPTLRKLLKDPYRQVKQAAVDAIARMANRGDLPQVLGMLKHRDRWIREGAIRAIAQLGDERDLSFLAEIVASSAPSDYAAAASKALILLDERLYCPSPRAL